MHFCCLPFCFSRIRWIFLGKKVNNTAIYARPSDEFSFSFLLAFSLFPLPPAPPVIHPVLPILALAFGLLFAPCVQCKIIVNCVLKLSSKWYYSMVSNSKCVHMIIGKRLLFRFLLFVFFCLSFYFYSFHNIIHIVVT